MASFSKGGTFPAERREAIFRFLNTPFALLIMSSVILTGIGRLYSNWQAANVRRQSAVIELTNLNTELSFRDHNIASAMFDMRNGDATACHRIWQNIVADDQYHPAIPEFKNTHIIGLLAKAKFYVRSRSGKQKIDAAEPAASYMQRLTELYKCRSDMAGALNKASGRVDLAADAVFVQLIDYDR